MRGADRVFSLYIREKYSLNGYVVCVTCGAKKSIKDIHAGHYIPRTHKSLRFNERNVHPQCSYCNTYLNGNLEEYKKYLINRYGEEVISYLESKKREIGKWGVYEFNKVKKKYEKKRNSKNHRRVVP